MGHTHLSFVVEITSPPNPSICTSSLSSLPYWQLPPLKVSTQLDTLESMEVFMDMDMLVLLDMVLMVPMDMVLDLDILDTLPQLLLLPQLSLPQLPETMPSQLPVSSKKHQLLKRSS